MSDDCCCQNEDEVIEIDDCLKDRHWYAFLCSSLISFFTGLLCVLTWRICAWTWCRSACLRGKQQEPAVLAGIPTNKENEEEEAKVGFCTSAQDWAGGIISGQTTTGQIVVSLILIFLNELYWFLVWCVNEIIKFDFRFIRCENVYTFIEDNFL